MKNIEKLFIKGVPGCPSGPRGQAGDLLSRKGHAGSNPAPGVTLLRKDEEGQIREKVVKEI